MNAESLRSPMAGNKEIWHAPARAKGTMQTACTAHWLGNNTDE